MTYNTYLLRLCVWNIVVVLVVSFNIDPRESAVEYLRADNNRSEGAATSNKGHRQVGFYGDQIKFTDESRILVSSPQWEAAKSMSKSQQGRKSCGKTSTVEKGTLSICTVNVTKQTTCTNACQPMMEDLSIFGEKIENRGRFTWACSPSEVVQCGNNSSHRLPGLCFESENTGRTWNWMRGMEPECPVTQQKLDIMFVLDGSGSVRRNFGDIKTWTQHMALKFDIQKGINQIGVVQFSSYQRGRSLDKQNKIETEVSLGQYKKNSDLSVAIGNILFNDGGTYTAHAMNKTVMDFRRGSRWSDKDTQKVMIILTDGVASDRGYLPGTANYVRSLGIITFAVGVGSGYNRNELRIIATGDATSDERVLAVDSFSGLESIVKDLSSQILNIVLEGSGNAKIASYKLEMGQRGFSIASTRVGSYNRLSYVNVKFSCAGVFA